MAKAYIGSWQVLLVIFCSPCLPSKAFFLGVPDARSVNPTNKLQAEDEKFNNKSRRTVLHELSLQLTLLPPMATMAASVKPFIASAASFTAGGTLVDREVGVQVGNPEASPSRKPDNSNVIFDKDHYFKFGVAAPWIEPGNTDFPKSMPFTPSQQRYDALKKYGSRVKSGIQYIQSLEDSLKRSTSSPDNESFASVIPDPALTQEYMFRPMGLLANSFLASENTGATNELFLARWYVNEMYLQLLDARNASSKDQAMKSFKVAKKAVNSYLGLMNRVINAKVGDKFELLSV